MAETGESFDIENLERDDLFSFPKVVNGLVSRLRFNTFSFEADLGLLFLLTFDSFALDFDSSLLDLTDLIVN